MRLPVRLTPQHPLRKVAAAVLIAALATGIAVVAHRTPGTSVAMTGLDNTLYDAFYHFRKEEDRKGGPVVIIDVGEDSLEQLAKSNRLQWPWPRFAWLQMVKYLQACGARAVVFDLIFKEPRAFDTEFGKVLDEARIPVILGNAALPNGSFDIFAPVVQKPPLFGATNMPDEKVIREYFDEIHGQPTLAIAGARGAGATLPTWADRPFLLHYYGPMKRKDGTFTFKYVPAYAVIYSLQHPDQAAKLNVSPDIFKDKIVVIGGTAQAIYDLKPSPLSAISPGVEIQATAIDNLLTGQRVELFARTPAIAFAFVASLLAAIGVVIPQRVTVKLVLALWAAALLGGLAIAAFIAWRMRWLPIATPMCSLILTIVIAFAWSYVTEDRQRRLVLKALTQYVSPDVASEIERNPSALKLGGQRREMTVMFTDIQGFTDLSESMDSEKLSDMLNFYLGEMSALILANNGTLDKYIGDAIMSFWNAPVLQPGHAALACRAALAMRDREAAIRPQLAQLGAGNMLTRIGINTGPMVFGNMGSPVKFNYSVLGDSVNLGSRLEGANKIYGSRILLAESTAREIEGFVVRKLDLMRVKGKQKPVIVYELLAHGPANTVLRDRVNGYEMAFAHYQARGWDAAEGILRPLMERFPDDGPVQALLNRIAHLRHDPPPDGWDGVFIAKDK